MMRKPAVAGRFYPASRAHLEDDIKKYLDAKTKSKKVTGLVAPHAGYMYSGHVAGATFAAVEIPENIIILSPNHTGMGARAAIMSEGEWMMPMGNVPINSELAAALMKNCGDLKDDATAHYAEHSLEVELPFLQYLRPDFKFVPITVSHLNFDACEIIGKAIAKTIKTQEGEILIVASSDMTHYEPQQSASSKDKHAIERVLALDPKGLFSVCAGERITMCGVVPATIMLVAAKELGATKGELIKYATSGEVSGDYTSVVGYAGMVVY